MKLHAANVCLRNDGSISDAVFRLTSNHGFIERLAIVRVYEIEERTIRDIVK